MLVSSHPSRPDFPINPGYPPLGTSRPAGKHMRQGGRYQPWVEGFVVDRADQGDRGPHHDAPEAGHGREVHVGDLVQLQVEERSKRLLGLWGSEVGPGGWAIFNGGWKLSTPLASVVGLSLSCHSLTKTHPHGEDEGREGTNKGCHLIAIREEHAKHKSTKHWPPHDPKDANGCLKNSREVFDHEDDDIADDAKSNGKELGD